jgi:hypothetical protein
MGIIDSAVIKSHMNDLGLSLMASSFDSYMDEQSRNENTLLERIADLMELEYIPRKEREGKTRLKLSGIPQQKRLEDFDLSWLKGGLSKPKFDELASLAFIERKGECIFPRSFRYR